MNFSRETLNLSESRKCLLKDIFFKICWPNPAKVSVMYRQWTATVHIFLRFQLRGLRFKTYFKNIYFDTKISNYLQTEILEFFFYWFYIKKLQKYRTIPSQHTNYLHKWLIYLNLTCLLRSCLFFSTRFLSICQPRTTLYLLWLAGPSGLPFYGSGLVCLLSCVGIVNAGWLSSIRSNIFLQMKFFKAVPPNRLPFFSGQLSPSSYSATFGCSRMLFCINNFFSEFIFLIRCSIFSSV